uniref:Transposase n=1 Tax=Ascaris lumbricoides TaxID=6252 RepID=A0A0M3IU76_ASCLU
MRFLSRVGEEFRLECLEFLEVRVYYRNSGSLIVRSCAVKGRQYKREKYGWYILLSVVDRVDGVCETDAD